MARPADTGKAKPLHGETAKTNIADQGISPGTQDMSGGNVGRGGFNVEASGGTKSGKVKNVSTPRHLQTGTARGKGGSRGSGAKYSGQSGGGYVPGFDK